MPSPDIILEPIENDNNGGHQFIIRCIDHNTLEGIRHCPTCGQPINTKDYGEEVWDAASQTIP